MLTDKRSRQAGSDDAIKIWLNGAGVHNNPIDRAAEEYLDRFSIDLKQGDNLLLVKVSERAGGWSMFVGIDADINGDGIVNIVDLVKVAGELGTGAAAPSAHPHALEMLTAADIKLWLSQAQHADLTDISTQRGILFLEQLLAALIPKETTLLANYPNPFNPETWIPYQLAKDADVTLHIYAVNGTLVRTLTLGHQPAGMYQSRSRAAYWDGKNAVGEQVAGGLYFYQFEAGDVSLLRKMVTLK